jgi:hydroxymethylbilane synthase
MRLGTRGSALALAQARHVALLLGDAEVVTATASAPRTLDKSRWVRDLEEALLEGRIDLAVHSAKDLPEELPDGLALLGAPARASAEDVLCGAEDLDALPRGARVGTSSLRRTAQLLATREIVAIEGNVDTRLAKLGDRTLGLDAIALARAGLQRLDRQDEIGVVLTGEHFVPAPGQGTLALEGRVDDQAAQAAARALTDRDSLSCLLAERALSRALGGSCNTPLGAHAEIEDSSMRVRAWVGLPDGSSWCSDELAGNAAEPEKIALAVAARMQTVGASELLRAAETMVLDQS